MPVVEERVTRNLGVADVELYGLSGVRGANGFGDYDCGIILRLNVRCEWLGKCASVIDGATKGHRLYLSARTYKEE